MAEEKSVLIIDADAPSRIYLGRLLAQRGYKPLQAASGKEGLILAWRDRPSAILIDPRLPDLSGEEVIQKLRRDARTATTPCMALSSDPDPKRVASCLAAGCNEYFLKSAANISKVLEALDALFVPESPIAEVEKKQKIPRGKMIVFLSAKGGTGTSSLCANLAATLVRLEKGASVVTADLVLPLGSIAPIVGYNGAVNLYTLSVGAEDALKPQSLKENLPRIPTWGFHLLAAAPDPEAANQIRAERIGPLVDALREAFDFVFVDLGRSLSRISLPILQQADVILLIVTPDSSTTFLTRLVLEFLMKKGIPTKRILPLINRPVGLEGLSKSRVDEEIGLATVYTIPYLGGNVTVANHMHQPLIEKFAKDTIALSLRDITRDVLRTIQKLREEILSGGTYGV
ncbi:MAG: response regulator [Anaerolineales bacterium]